MKYDRNKFYSFRGKIFCTLRPLCLANHKRSNYLRPLVCILVMYKIMNPISEDQDRWIWWKKSSKISEPSRRFADDHLTANQLSETDQLGVWSVTSCRIRSAGDVQEWDDELSHELRSLSKQASESGVGEGVWSEAHSGKSKGLLGEVEASSDCFNGTVTSVPATNGWSRSISAVHLFLGSRKKHFSRKSFPSSDNSDGVSGDAFPPQILNNNAFASVPGWHCHAGFPLAISTTAHPRAQISAAALCSELKYYTYYI